MIGCIPGSISEPGEVVSFLPNGAGALWRRPHGTPPGAATNKFRKIENHKFEHLENQMLQFRQTRSARSSASELCHGQNKIEFPVRLFGCLASVVGPFFHLLGAQRLEPPQLAFGARRRGNFSHGAPTNFGRPVRDTSEAPPEVGRRGQPRRR